MLALANNSAAACQCLPVAASALQQLCHGRGCPSCFGGVCLLCPPFVALAVLAVYLLSINRQVFYRYIIPGTNICMYLSLSCVFCDRLQEIGGVVHDVHGHQLYFVFHRLPPDARLIRRDGA